MIVNALNYYQESYLIQNLKVSFFSSRFLPLSNSSFHCLLNIVLIFGVTQFREEPEEEEEEEEEGRKGVKL